MSLLDFDAPVDVDEMRCLLTQETNDALELGDELALAVATGRFDDARTTAEKLGQVRGRMRALRSIIRVEEGQR